MRAFAFNNVKGGAQNTHKSVGAYTKLLRVTNLSLEPCGILIRNFTRKVMSKKLDKTAYRVFSGRMFYLLASDKSICEART